jgi:hypothetical protein
VDTSKVWSLVDADLTELAVVQILDELLQAIFDIPKEATPNILVNLYPPGKHTFRIGIAGPADKDNRHQTESVACVTFMDESGNLPTQRVVGRPELSAEGGNVVFRGEHVTVPLRYCVSLDVLTRIVRHYFETGTLPDWIAWEAAE